LEEDLSIELNDKEQAVINAACVKIEKASQEAQQLQQAAEQAARKAEALGHEARGIYRGLMELRGDNPDAHQVKWDGTAATIEELPKPEAPADNVVPLPVPQESAPSGNA
jgi:hypothetical protein